MKTIFAIFLFSTSLHAQSAFGGGSAHGGASAHGGSSVGPITSGTATDIPYTGSGGNTVMPTVSGTNNAGALFIWTDGTLSAVSICGNSVGSPAITHANTAPTVGTINIYITVGFSAGSCTVTYSSTGQSSGTFIPFSNAKQSGQPDATGAYVSSVTDGSSEGAMAITTVADKSIVLGLYTSSSNFITTPSSNGTFENAQSFGAAFIWISTATVTPAGSFSLKAKDGGAGVAYEAIGVSLAPL